MTYMVDDQKQRHRYPNPEEQVDISVHRHSHTQNATPQPENEAKKPLLLHLGDALMQSNFQKLRSASAVRSSDHATLHD